MADKQPAEGAAGGRLYTLSQVAAMTKISMPTLQRYKKQHQSRIPAVGKGRRQRYPEEALAVFEQIKEENVARRGRPRKSAAASKPKRGGRRTPPPKKPAARGRRKAAAAPKPAAVGQLLTLTEVCKRAGNSYPTGLRYVKTHLAEIPHEGAGRKRRFYPEAVEVFKRLRQQSGRGGRKPGRKAAATRGRRRAAAAMPAAAPAAGLSPQAEKRIQALENAHAKLEKKFSSLMARLRKPRRVI